MRLSDLNDAKFNRVMQDLLSQTITMADKIGYAYGGICDFNTEYPFPLSEKVKTVWDYATGHGEKPTDMEKIIQELCDLAWCPILATSYDIPASFWYEPLGFMITAAWARDKLDAGHSLTPDELAILAGTSRQTVSRGLVTKNLSGRKIGKLWQIPAATCREYLDKDKTPGRPKKQEPGN